MFRHANEQASTLKKAPSKGCETSKLRDHFKSHFNPTYDNDSQPPELFENPPLFVEKPSRNHLCYPSRHLSPHHRRAQKDHPLVEKRLNRLRPTTRTPKICRLLRRVSQRSLRSDGQDLDKPPASSRLGYLEDYHAVEK